MSAFELLNSTDLGQTLAQGRRYDIVIALSELRKMPVLDRPSNYREVVEATARHAVDAWPECRFTRSCAFAALMDVGQAQEIRGRLGRVFETNGVNNFDLRVAARAMRLTGSRNSATWMHALADHLEGGGEPLGPEVVGSVVDRLFGRWMPAGAELDFMETDSALSEAELVALEQPIDIPTLPGYRIRPIKSRGQCDRAANILKNCLSSYRFLVKSGAARVFTLEENGVPVEAIEVHPRTGRVKQWKGKGNVPAEPTRRRIVEEFLHAQRLAVVR